MIFEVTTLPTGPFMLRRLSAISWFRAPGEAGKHWHVEHRLPYSSTAAGEARALAKDFLPAGLDDARGVEFLVMVSEIVGNAVRHGEPESDGRIGFRLDSEEKVVRAVVTDSAPEFTFDRETFEKANLDHMGLLMVDGLADRWGLSLDGKKAVWFEVDVEPSAEER
jgi:serine/threonine-protein kinase RsbW